MKHVGSNTIGQMMMNRTNLQIDGFNAAEGTFDGREALVVENSLFG